MKASEANIQKTYLKDYQPTDYKITDVYLDLELEPENTLVKSQLKLKRTNPKAKQLFLNGEKLKLLSVSVDGVLLSEDEYVLTEKNLTLTVDKDEFTVETTVEISPKKNLDLEGLYLSNGILCTQNEPEGFRRITYFIDRPDNMAVYTVKLTATKDQFPVLLSNGNCLEKGELSTGKHWTKWHDPFPKPSYLFAVVAGDLGVIRDEFTTRSGRTIPLSIYCDPGDESRCIFAMESLKNAMKWDEERFDLEYDLDQFMIVSVSSFNSGAMENKGLNIFNSALILADQKTATDTDYLRIESVVGHEYFHNWTGNRITCRDWFQLTLKEGLTVFRDQEFSSDLNSRPVQRIEDVRRLYEVQFPEDASPMAHPIRPESFVQINNFYTATVYEKGAEVIRMIHTFVGEEGFQKGMKKYFELYDNQAVTTEDFIHAMKLANPHFEDEAFKNWYRQPGTPRVEFNGVYNEKDKTYTLSYKQENPKGDGSPVLIPIKVGFIDPQGKEFKPQLNAEGQNYWDQSVISLKENSGQVTFTEVTEPPTLSLNRSFSAPVLVKKENSLEEDLHLLRYDQDHFNRYQVGQKVMADWILKGIERSESAALDPKIIIAFSEILNDSNIDPAMKSLLLAVPTEAVLHQSQNPIEFEKTKEVRDQFAKEFAEAFETQFVEIYETLQSKTQGGFAGDKVGGRALKNLALSYLARLDGAYKDLVASHFGSADNMTDQFQGIVLMNRFFPTQSISANESFYNQWRKNDLVLQKWIMAQTQGEPEVVFEKIKELLALPEYKDDVPNYVRSLWGGFSRNFLAFHHASGKGYELMSSEIVKLDGVNRSIAAALTKSFRIKPSLDDARKVLVNKSLEKILGTPGISVNTAEVAEQILKS